MWNATASLLDRLDAWELGMFGRFLCILVILGVASVISSFLPRSNMSLYQTLKSRTMLIMVVWMLSITPSTMLWALKIS